jgi:3-dehydroquinate synthase
VKYVPVPLKTQSYRIDIGPGLLEHSGRRLTAAGFAGKAVVVTNPVVKRRHGPRLRKSLDEAGFNVTWLTVSEGEAFKSLESARRLFEELAGAYIERNTPLLALGGGVVGDLAGFVAATYLRGLPFFQVPTTLLAQVDSSIGGKVAVNLGNMKNMVGAFYQPQGVIADIDTLKTLPPPVFTAGLAEVVKCAFIGDDKFLVYLEDNLEKIRNRDGGALEETVFYTARIKAEIVVQDEKETGVRALLNFGHTIGHAVEAASDFAISHGEAVAMGMMAAGRLSHRLGYLREAELVRLADLIRRAGLPTAIPPLNRERLIEALRHDKKRRAKTLRFVLLNSLGKGFVSEEVTPALIGAILEDSRAP